MFTQKMVLVVKGIEDRLYRFECEPDAPLGEVHDALATMTSFTVEEIKKHGKPLEEESDTKEEKEESQELEESEQQEECESDCSK